MFEEPLPGGPPPPDHPAEVENVELSTYDIARSSLERIKEEIARGTRVDPKLVDSMEESLKRQEKRRQPPRKKDQSEPR